MVMKTKIEILEETIAYYSEDVKRRATDGEYDGCYYLADDGRMCAVGRCLSNAALIEQVSQEIFDGNQDITSLCKEVSNMDSYFKEEYQGHEVSFWNSLQLFHDIESNWNKEGLSKLGKERLKELKELYSEDMNN